MLTIGISCGFSSASKAVKLKDFLKGLGYPTYILSTYSDEDLKKKLRSTVMIVSLLDKDWWESSRGSFEMNEMHRSNTESGKPMCIIPVLLEKLSLLPPKNLDKYITKECQVQSAKAAKSTSSASSPTTRSSSDEESGATSGEFRGLAFQKGYSGFGISPEKRLEILEKYPPLKTLFRIATPFVDGINYPDSFGLSVVQCINEAAQEIQSEDNRTQVTLRRRRMAENGFLNICTKYLLSTIPYKIPITVWNMKFELYEYSEEIMDIAEADNEEELFRCLYSPLHLQLNRELGLAFRQRAKQLMFSPIVREEQLHVLFPCKLDLQPKKMNFILKAIYKDNQVNGFICFLTVFENAEEPVSKTPRREHYVSVKLEQVEQPAVPELEPGAVVLQDSTAALPEEHPHRQQHQSQPLEDSFFQYESSHHYAQPPTQNPMEVPETPFSLTDSGSSETVSPRCAAAAGPDVFSGSTASFLVDSQATRGRKNLYMKTPTDYLHPDRKKPLSEISSPIFKFKTYSGPITKRKRRTFKKKTEDQDT
eukprot:TRINITY_DN9321_c0_g1_i1.p1 TRINITY_DN9321_c0_g1~~TRINITY_DN9321_c0_g1_i1.p1  ORF type:complete len:536 (-),score=184.18 TRINITY_DN9321_c0_g1_i1:35-1642(-)